MRARRLAILATIFVFGIIALGRVGDALVDWLWFSSIGRGGVFWTLLGTRALLFLAVFAVSAGALWLSGALALRFAAKPSAWPSRTAFAQHPGTEGRRPRSG